MGRAPTDTKTRLIETATELLWRDSYGSVSVDDICAKAGVQKGSFYHFFPSKLELALASVDRCMQEAKILYDDIFSATRPPVERFALLAKHLYEKQAKIEKELGRVYGCPFATLGSELAGQDKKIQAKINEICTKNLAYYEGALRDLIADGTIDKNTDIKSKAEEIYAFVLGQLMMARIKNDLSFMKNHLKDALFSVVGIRKESKAA